MIKNDGWTFGCEHEFADWDRRVGPLPDGFGYDIEKTIVNSNGVAWAPEWPAGGEINTPPSKSPEKQCTFLEEILKTHPDCAVNYRTNLHVHVRVPGLKDDLDRLKMLAGFNGFWLPELLPIIEPIPAPTREDYPDEAAYKGARKRFHRRKVSHHTVLGADRTKKQLAARSLKAFFEAEVPWTKPKGRRSPSGGTMAVPNLRKSKPMWHAQARAAVNVRQLLQTDTLEFRHFPGTLDAEELLTAVEWCADYLLCAFNGWDPVAKFALDYASRPWPKFEPYDHWLEERYLLTSHEKNKDKESVYEHRQKFVASPRVVPWEH